MITGAEFYQMSEAHEGVLNYSDTEHPMYEQITNYERNNIL